MVGPFGAGSEGRKIMDIHLAVRVQTRAQIFYQPDDPKTGLGRKIYGRGSSDTKSGIATMMDIARKLKDSNLKRKIIFI